MPIVPLKAVGDDFLAMHIGQLLVRQPCPTQDVATPRQRPARVEAPSSSKPVESSASSCSLATEHVSFHGPRDLRAGSAEIVNNTLTSRGSTDSGMPSSSRVSFSARDSISSISCAGSEMPMAGPTKDGASEPDLSSQTGTAFDGHRHRRTGSEAITSPRISFTTSFGAKLRRSRSRVPSHAQTKANSVQLARNASVRSSIGSTRSNESVSPLDIYTQSPWAYPGAAMTPPLQSINELDAHEQWAAVFNSDALQQSATELSLKLGSCKARAPTSIETKDANDDDRCDGEGEEEPAAAEVAPRQKLVRSTTSPSPASTELSDVSPATPMSHRFPSLPGSQVSQIMSRHSSAQRVKLLLIPKGEDGRTFRFIESESGSSSDSDTEVKALAALLHRPVDEGARRSSIASPAPCGETLGPAKASQALHAAIVRDEDPHPRPGAQSSTPDKVSTAVPSEAARKPAVRRMTLLERTMAAERDAKTDLTIEILGQRIERRGIPQASSKPLPGVAHPPVSRRPSNYQPTDGYGQDKRMFKLRAVGDPLSATADAAIPVVLPVQPVRKNTPARKDTEGEARTRRWAHEHTVLSPSPTEEGQCEATVTAAAMTVLSPVPEPALSAVPEEGSAVPDLRPTKEDATDYFMSWSAQQRVDKQPRRNIRFPSAAIQRTGSSFMTHTTSSTSTSTDVTNVLLPDKNGFERFAISIPASSLDTLAIEASASQKKISINDRPAAPATSSALAV